MYILLKMGIFSGIQTKKHSNIVTEYIVLDQFIISKFYVTFCSS